MKTFAGLGLLGLCLVLGVYAQTPEPTTWGDAVWIWDDPNAHQTAQTDDPRYFRQRFDLADLPAKAELWVTADNEYTAYVNGQKVGHGTSWNSVDKYDVAKHLAKGPNVLAIEAKNHGGVAGLIARLAVQTADKKTLLISTGAKTKTSPNNTGAWTKADFADTTWAAASVLGDTTIGPWHIAGGAGSAAIGGKPGKSGDVPSDGKIKERLSAADELKQFTVPKDFVIELVADEPNVINPVTMTVDPKGRILVSESHTYRYGPSGSPVKPFKNPVIRLDPNTDGKGFTRTLIADGFDDPAMGIAVKGNKLWISANNYLYSYDYSDTGLATNKKTLVIDKNKAWNPFGMFVLEFGPDGLLYLSVGDHKIALEGPTNKIDSRGTSGVIVRMNLDGSNMERLTQGFRVPYSFDMDPFGQLWLLSNGEGNPNRFAKIIPGVDYHCFTRGKVDNSWLAGNSPLAPPVFETLRGAHTQLMRYYGAAYPADYQGALLLCNWGAHGFHGPNRAIFRYVPNERGEITVKEPFVSCNDPHFRPSHIALDPEGNLLIADWYGRDDESDLTGRIWRVRYTGKTETATRLADNATEPQLIEALGSTSHIDREKAVERLTAKAKENPKIVGAVKEHAAVSKNPLGAANALWTLMRIRDSEAELAVLSGAKNPSPLVRRLSLDLGRRLRDIEMNPLAKENVTYLGFKLNADGELFTDPGNYPLPTQQKLKEYLAAAKKKYEQESKTPPEHKLAILLRADKNARYSKVWDALTTCKEAGFPPPWQLRVIGLLPKSLSDTAESLLNDPDLAVRLEAALTINSPVAIIDTLKSGTAADTHLRYQAAAGLAKNTSIDDLTSLLNSTDPDLRLAGLITIDIAGYENYATKKAALTALSQTLTNPKVVDMGHAIFLIQQHGDAGMLPVLEKLILREDLPPAVTGKAMLAYRGLSGKLPAVAGKKFLEGVQKGTLALVTPADHLTLLELLESEGPTAFSLEQLAKELRSNQPQIKPVALALARKFGPKSSAVAGILWPQLLNPKAKTDDALDTLATLAVIQSPPLAEGWTKLLSHADPLVRTDAVRWWRSFKKQPELVEALVKQIPALIKADQELSVDLDAVLESLGVPSPLASEKREPKATKDDFAKHTFKAFAAWTPADKQKHGLLGKQVFERAACVKCHTAVTQNTPLAPSLKGIASQKLDYLIESVLYPSKIIKTGFETETVITSDGKSHAGLVKDEGTHLRIQNLDKDVRVLKTDVEQRSVQKLSIMPEGQEATLTRREFTDLIAYLAGLK